MEAAMTTIPMKMSPNTVKIVGAPMLAAVTIQNMPKMTAIAASMVLVSLPMMDDASDCLNPFASPGSDSKERTKDVG